MVKLLRQLQQIKKMSTFVSTVNPVTGKMDWIIQSENYDYHQEIARSAYADMLHDTERNKKYYLALESAIKIKRNQGQRVDVLDIGTGTGLLSMMAARLGADTVTACEAFTPMAECAKQIIKDNKFQDKIRLIPKRSTDVQVGADGDMAHKANILVTEVFDTELIGEGAIGTFTHAHKNLLEEDCIVVPSLAFMYVQLVSSDFIRQWREIRPIEISQKDDIRFPKAMIDCAGAPSLHDIQMEEIPQEKFDIICDPVQVFRFDFTGKSQLPAEEESVVEVNSQIEGNVDGIFMWWDLQMDTKGDIMLSCAPSWGHPNVSELQWRDHWMQAIFYPSIPLPVQNGEEVKVISNHDEYSLWFNIDKSSSGQMTHSSGPACTCGIHLTYSRSRIGMLNDLTRRSVYKNVLTQNLKGEKNCLIYSNGTLLALMAAKLTTKQVFHIEPHPMCRKAVKSFIVENVLDNNIKIISKDIETVTGDDLNGCKIDLVMGEPYLESSVLPWHHIAFWYGAEQLAQHMNKASIVLPCSLCIKAVAVEFKDLWKIRSAVGICEGFDISRFDKLIEQSSDIADALIEPQPLWEYPCCARSKALTVFQMDYTDFLKMDQDVYSKHEVVQLIHTKGLTNGVALWAEFDFDEQGSISSGPTKPFEEGEKITWDFYSKQGVHLFKEKELKSSDDNVLNIHVKFQKKTGSFDFTFNVE